MKFEVLPERLEMTAINKLLTEFAAKHAVFQHDWTTAVGTPDYVKTVWVNRDKALCEKYRQLLDALDYHGPLLHVSELSMKTPDNPPPAYQIAYQIHVGNNVDASAIAVLSLHCDMEIPGGQEFYITRRPRVPFLPERLAIRWPAAVQVDFIDLKIGNFSLFSRADETWPGRSFAACWDYKPQDADVHNAWGPLPAIVTSVDGTDDWSIGGAIPRRVCQVAQDIIFQIRVCSQEPLPTFEAILLGKIPTF